MKIEEVSNSRLSPHEVLWLPSPPSEGSLSMNRYWSELDRCRLEHPPAGLTIRSILKDVPVATRRQERLSRFWQKYVVYPVRVRLRVRRASLVHLLDHANGSLFQHVSAKVLKVATVHDLAPLRMPGDLTPAQQARFRRSVSFLRQADLLLADSHHTARDAAELIGCAPERIRVLPLGVNLAQVSTPRPAPLPDWDERFAGRRVVVSVGSTPQRKNLEALPGFFARLKQAGWPVVLVRIGDPLPAALASELRLVLKPDGLCELGKVSPEQLAGAYQRASFLIFPSRLEGFGLPVIEAMAAGCPVVCSTASSLPEVGGDAALYFDPDDIATAAKQAELLWADEEYRQSRIRDGLQWSGRFSWQAHFSILVAIYRELLDRGVQASGSGGQ